MGDVEIVLVALLLAVVALSAAARMINVPYPIVLVVGGAVLGLLPVGMPEVELDPDLVLVIFLPPLLYSGAFFANLRDLRADLRPITLLSVGLVLATVLVVAAVAHALIDDLSWPAAFVLGAIVGPTDPVAATAIARRLGVPRRLVSILEGESLVNDATALVAYRIAIGAATGAVAFSLLDASWEFLWKAAGGIALGLAVGWVIAQVRRRLDDPLIENTIGLLSGYAAYVPAEHLHLSGGAERGDGRLLRRLAGAEDRLPGHPAAGLRHVGAARVPDERVPVRADRAAAARDPGLARHDGLVDAARLRRRGQRGGGAHAARLAAHDRLRHAHARPARVGARPARNVADANRDRLGGMRGAVSLAAALALDADFPQRDLIVFLTFAVIFVTLVLQGLTLPPLIRLLGVTDDGTDEAKEDLKARLVATKAALARIDELLEEEWTRDDTLERMRQMYEYRKRRLAARTGKIEADEDFEDRSLTYQTMVREVLEAQRREIVRLRNEGTISNDVMHRIERELDLEDERLEI